MCLSCLCLSRVQCDDASLCLPHGWSAHQVADYLLVVSQADLQTRLLGQTLTYGLLARFVYLNAAFLAAILKKN